MFFLTQEFCVFDHSGNKNGQTFQTLHLEYSGVPDHLIMMKKTRRPLLADFALSGSQSPDPGQTGRSTLTPSTFKKKKRW